MQPPLLARALAATALLTAATTACDGGGLSEAERAAIRAADAVADSAEQALAPVPLLSRADSRDLREHLNDAHLASARQLGVGAVADTAEVARLVAADELVRLQDTTSHWVVRELEHSLPYVTPDAAAMLIEIGRRFHAALDSLGVPRYRFEITSVLRTAALQADLRRSNPNAAQGASSHEFGTTVDIAYNEFSPPAPSAPSLAALQRRVAEEGDVRELAVERASDRLDAVADERAQELKAILGEVLRNMQEEGRLQALLERAQPIYHITVAERRSAPRPATE